MINLDQLAPDQSTSLLDHQDWQQKAPPPATTLASPAPAKFPADARPPTDPVTPADAVDPIPAPSNQNPSPETPGDLLSAPNDNDSSSSLSPAPENEEDPDRPRAEAQPAVSRQSTPLTELSGPATPSRAKEDDAAEHAEEAQPRPAAKPEGEDGEGKSDSAEDAATVVALDATVEGDKIHPPAPVAPDAPTNVSGKAPEPAPAANGSASPAVPEPAAAEAHQPADEKASAILQLNTELLKVCIECQTRSMMQSPEFNTYAARLQSNLTWLAAAADRARQTQIPLPIMSPPASLPFVPAERERINALYQRLPLLFAKEIAKRQREGLKRAAEPADQPAMRKRLDTGERRVSGENMNIPASMGAAAGSPPHARSPSVVSNGAGGHVSMSPDGLGMMTPQQQPQTPAMRVSPESATPQQQPPHAFPQNLGAGPGALSDAQVRERQRQMAAMRTQAQAAQLAKDRMPPPQNAAGPAGGNPQMMQAILTSFGQPGLQNYHSLQQGASHPFVNYMVNNVQGFMQLPLQQQLQRMALVQNNIQQARAQQQQRAAAAAATAGMNGSTPQGMPDAASPFSRHSGSPPNVNPGATNSFQGLANPGMMPGMGLGAQANLAQMNAAQQQARMQASSAGPQQVPMQMQQPGAGPRPTSSGPMNVTSLTSLTPQERQLLLMQQQMHSRSNDGVMNPNAQQAYAEKMRQGMQMQQQQHSQQHSSGSPPADGTGTPRMQQKRLSSGMGQPDPYHMALYNTQQRQAAVMRPGPQQQGYGGTVNPGMMYGGMGANPNPTPTPNPGQQQAWQTQQQQQPQQQQFHAVSPAALQHHPDVGTPRPESSASNNAVAPADTMGDSFESLFNWGGT